MHILEAALVSNLLHYNRGAATDGRLHPAPDGQTCIASHTRRTSMVAAQAIGWVLARATASSIPPQRTSS